VAREDVEDQAEGGPAASRQDDAAPRSYAEISVEGDTSWSDRGG